MKKRRFVGSLISFVERRRAMFMPSRGGPGGPCWLQGTPGAERTNVVSGGSIERWGKLGL